MVDRVFTENGTAEGLGHADAARADLFKSIINNYAQKEQGPLFEEKPGSTRTDTEKGLRSVAESLVQMDRKSDAALTQMWQTFDWRLDQVRKRTDSLQANSGQNAPSAGTSGAKPSGSESSLSIPPHGSTSGDSVTNGSLGLRPSSGGKESGFASAMNNISESTDRLIKLSRNLTLSQIEATKEGMVTDLAVAEATRQHKLRDTVANIAINLVGQISTLFGKLTQGS